MVYVCMFLCALIRSLTLTLTLTVPCAWLSCLLLCLEYRQYVYAIFLIYSAKLGLTYYNMK